METPDGYIWIGTYAGLYRYDGQNFMMMDFDSVKNVNALYVDESGRLWIGTNDKGISIYDNGEITEVIDKNHGLASNSIRCIGEDDKGNYYVGTSASLCILSDHKGMKVDQTLDTETYGNNITISTDGTIAIVTNEGELVLMKDEQVDGIYELGADGVYFTSSSFGEDGKLRVATSASEIYTWDFQINAIDTESVIHTGELRNIHTMYEDAEGRMWVCTDSGIGYIEDGVFYKVATGEFNGSIDSMLMDYQDNLWFTSSRLGVLKLAHNSFRDIYGQCGISDKVVNSVTMWNGLLYSGTDEGLDIIDLNTNEQVHNELTELLTDNRIRCLNVDSNNHLWIATSAGIGLLEVLEDGSMHAYDTQQGTIGDRFRSTIELSDGTIVAAENTGIDFIRNGVVTTTLGEEDGLTNPQILSLLELDSDTLLAGSDGDGIMVIENDKVIRKITEENGLPSGVILRMVKLNKGVMIVTSNSLCYMDSKGKILELKEFPYANNFDVVEDANGYLWVLSSAGIYIVDEESLLNNEELTVELLDSRKGFETSLTANSWNYIDGSQIYLSCSTGVYRIDMNNYAVQTDQYRIIMDYVDSNDKSYAMKENEVTEISSDISRIRIRPELLNYSLNDPYLSFYLEGFDDKRTVVQQSELTDVTYTNLPAGKYVFHLAVLDNTGTNVIENHVYTLEKQPQFWEHGWFMAYLMLVCALGIGYVTWLIAVLHSNKIIEKQKQEIELARRQADMGNETILAIAKTVDAKDGYTSQHSARVAGYSVMIAKKLGWDDKACDNLQQIALLHDIGKIGIPDAILNKPQQLTDAEYEIMKSHVKIGAEILKDFTLIENVADGVLFHHEKYDVTGYYYGLKGEEIPLDARIIGLADTFDAMTANRVYREHLSMDRVIEELEAGKGTQFDPALVDILLELIKEGQVMKDVK